MKEKDSRRERGQEREGEVLTASGFVVVEPKPSQIVNLSVTNRQRSSWHQVEPKD